MYTPREKVNRGYKVHDLPLFEGDKDLEKVLSTSVVD